MNTNTASKPANPIDEARLHAFIGKGVGDLGAAISSCMVLLGDRLGLYKALAKKPLTPGALAAATGTNERYIREWCANQASGGYLTYDSALGTYALEPEQSFCLANPDSPVFFPGAYEVVAATFHALQKTEANFRSGKGMDWGEHHQCLFHGTEKFFKANYIGNLITSWLPALDGVVAKLTSGAQVADVGCGHGASTILMAAAFPASTFIGFDSHKPSIDVAKQRGRDAGITNISFEVARSTDFPGHRYDLVACFDCLHDMGDPVGAARHVREALSPDGTWMIVEPFAGDHVEDNLNPVGRVYYAASSMICVPASLAHGGPALGAQAGEATLRRVVVDGGGFTRFRRATQTPFNLVLEARP
jgi:2-polyprenyl-3-methyl-5-hydroxy-6-metoxy-1,4-benzoquinol methylase